MSTCSGLGVAYYLLTIYCTSLSDVDVLQNRPTKIRPSVRIPVDHWKLQYSILAFDRKPHSV